MGYKEIENSTPKHAESPENGETLLGRTKEVFEQKLTYIHYNPVKAGLCDLPEEYYYSSANFYHTGVDAFGFLSNSDE